MKLTNILAATALLGASLDTRHPDDVKRSRSGGRNLKTSKPFGKGPKLPPMTRLTDEKFMSASQKRAHRAGEEIWV